MHLEPNNTKLNLGSGPNAPTGWLNVDGSWNARLSNYPYLRKVLTTLRLLNAANSGIQWTARPLVHDLTKPLPFNDNTVSAIYASHVLEHLYLEDAQKLLLECRRVLRTDGVIRMVVPDLRWMTEAYLKKKNDASLSEIAADQLNDKLAFRSPAAPHGNVLSKFYSLWKDFHHHKWMYDSDSLAYYMKRAGFTAVRKRGYLESDIPGIEEVEDPRRVLDGAGICVEALKA